MDRDQLVKRLMATFLEELQDQVQALNRELLALKKAPDGAERADRLKRLFRTAHSLKGAARSVNVRPIEDACHHLEEMLAGVRDGSRPADGDFFPLLLETADAIEEAGKRLQEEQDLSGSPLDLLLPRLAAAASRPAVASLPHPQPLSPRGRGEKMDSPLPPPGGEGSGVRGDGVPSESSPKLPPLSPAVEEREGRQAATVRIASEKLDALLATSGELLVARRRVPLRVEELEALRDAVGRWRGEWQTVERPLARLFPGNGANRSSVPRRLSAVLSGMGERLRQLEKDLDRLAGTLGDDGRLLDRLAGDLDEDVRRVRMLPFAEVCHGLERIVHDLAQAAGKDVELVIEGGEVELDRSVLEGLRDPLRHLVRNAVDHGIEPAEARRAAGKPSRARVTVGAVLRGAQVEVAVADDGRGIDLEALRRLVRHKGLPEPADERELARLVFQPGLSTSRLVTDVSGRGVGLDVVKSRVEELHGTVDLSFAPGGGTRFSLAVPLTLTTLRALLVGAAGQTFAFVGTNVQKLLLVDPREFLPLGGRPTLARGGAPLPVASLAETLGLPGRAPPPGGKVAVVMVAAGDRQMAFVVDELIAEQEVVVKGLGARVRRVPHVAGATILPSGRIALVLNAANVVRSALAGLRSAGRAAPRPAEAAAVKKRLLLAEDSLTTRTLEKTILEAAGYEVTTAVDGEQAWQLLQERGADLLISDVEMPRLDGFALTEAVRAAPRFRDLPVVLLTSRENEADRARGLAVGASAYLGKSAFDQRNLLETITQLL